MMHRLAMTDAQRDAFDKWINLDAEGIGWNLRRQFLVAEHIAAAVVQKLKDCEQLLRTQRLLRESAEKRVAWLESKVDPEILKPQARDEVSYKPPPEASD